MYFHHSQEPPKNTNHIYYYAKPNKRVWGAKNARKPQKPAGDRQDTPQDAPESPSTTKVKLHAGMVFSDLSSDGYSNAPRLNIPVIMHTMKNKTLQFSCSCSSVVQTQKIPRKPQEAGRRPPRTPQQA